MKRNMENRRKLTMTNNLTLKILIIIILCNLCFGVEKKIDTTEFPEELKQIVDSDTLPNYDKKAKEKEINDIIVENSLIIEEMFEKLDKYKELRKMEIVLKKRVKNGVILTFMKLYTTKSIQKKISA
jgi:hypothetical protein